MSSRKVKNTHELDVLAKNKTPKHSPYLNYGHYLAFALAAKKYGCLDAIKKTFPRRYKKIFALALYTLDPHRPFAQDFENWYFFNFCGIPKEIPASEIEDMYTTILSGDEQKEVFIENCIEKYKLLFPTYTEKNIAFTGNYKTALSLESDYSDTAYLGGYEDIPLWKITLFLDQQTGIPVQYTFSLDSNGDTSSIPYIKEDRKNDRWKESIHIIDGASFSLDRVNEEEINTFILVCPDDRHIIDYMMNTYAAKLKNNKNYYIDDEKIYGLCEEQYTYGKKTYTVALFYDEKRACEEIDDITYTVERMITFAKTRKNIGKDVIEMFSPWLKIEYSDRSESDNHGVYKITKKTKKIQDAVNAAGYFVLLSSVNQSPREILQCVRRQKRCQESFSMIQSQLPFPLLHSSKSDIDEGKFLLSYISLSMYEALRWFLKDYLHTHPEETLETAVGELETYQIYFTSDEESAPATSLTEKQKQIFLQLGLDTAAVEACARNAFATLKNI